MPRKKKAITKEYEFLGIKVSDYDIRVDGAINHEVRDSRHQTEDTKIYDCGTRLQISGMCVYPDERANESYSFTVYGSEGKHEKFDATLSDYHVRDEKGYPKYRKVRGESRPVYDPPDGIGLLERVRGTKDWSGFCWLPPQTVSDMLILLTQGQIKPLYISIHELKMGRTRWIVGLSLQTIDPAEE